MKKMIYVSIIIALLAIFNSCKQSKESLPSNVIADLNNAEAAMFNATSEGDSAAFRMICGVDYYTINENGEAHNLEETIPFVPRFKGGKYEFSEQSQRIFGNTALRSGRMKVFVFGQQVAESLYTTGWIFRDNRWQFIHWQGTMTGIMLASLRDKVALEPPPTAAELRVTKKKPDSKVN